MNILTNFFRTLEALLGCWIPLWVFLITRSFVGPQGVFENAVFVMIGLLYLGWLQFLLAVIFVFLMVIIWSPSRMK